MIPFLDALGPLAWVGVGLSVIGIVSNVVGSDKAADRETQAVELQAKQQAIAFQTKQMNNIQSTNQLISQQATAQLGNNMSLGSGSFQATINQTYKVGKQNEAETQLESDAAQAAASAKESAIASEKRQNMISGIAQLGGLALAVDKL